MPDKEIGKAIYTIEAQDKTEKGFKRAEQASQKNAEAMIKNLSGIEKAFTKLAKHVESSMDAVNKSMRRSVSETEGMNRRVLDRLAAMQRSNASAIRSQTRHLTSALEEIALQNAKTAESIASRSSASIGKVRAQLKSHEGYYDTLIGKFRTLAVNVWIATQAIQSLGSTIASVFKPGFEFTKQMETYELGTAGILTSMFNVNGKSVEWNTALAKSKELMGKIADDALVTTATVQELAQIFQSILAPAASAGWSLDQAREFAKVGANAVKAIGLPAQQVVQELRDLIMGGIRPASSTLAASLGIDDKLVKEWKNSGVLFDKLMERMRGFNMAAKETQNSFAGLFSNIQDGLQRVTSMSFTNVFSQFKAELKSIQGLFFDIVPVMANVNGEMKYIGDRAVFNNKTLYFFYEIGNRVLFLWNKIKQTFEAFKPTLIALVGVFDNLITNADKIGQLIGVWFATQNKWTAIIYLLDSLNLLIPTLTLIGEHIEKIIYLIEIKMIASLLGLSAGGATITALSGLFTILSSDVLATTTKIKLMLAFIVESFVPGAVAGFARVASAVKGLGIAIWALRGPLSVILALLGGIAYLNEQEPVQRAAKGLSETEMGIWGVTPDATQKQVVDISKLKTSDAQRNADDALNLPPDIMDIWETKYPVGGDDKGTKAANRAGIAKLKADLAEYLATLKEFKAELDYKKQENKISITDYWAKTLEATQKGLRAEIATLEEEKKFANDEAALYNMEKDIKAKKGELAKAEIDVKRKLAKDLKDFNKEILSIEKEYVSSFSNVSNELIEKVAKLSAEDKYKDIKNKVTMELVSTKDVKEAERLKTTLEQIAKLTNESSVKFTSDIHLANFNREANLYSAKLTEINDKEKMGLITSMEADSKRKTIYQESAAALQNEINALQRVWETTKDPSALINLENAKQKMRELERTTRQTSITMGTTFANSIASAFGDMITGTKTAADAFKSMANAIISELIRVMVVQKVVAAILKGMGFSGGGSVGYTNATVLARPTSGNMAPGNYSTGGAIFGAGTSTSDSIPAMLSNGEFVIKAASVKSIGLDKLNYMNTLGKMPKFAVGGYVGKANSGASGGVENIRVEMINKSGQNLEVKNTDVKINRKEMVVSLLIEGVATNTFGVTDMLKGLGGKA